MCVNPHLAQVGHQLDDLLWEQIFQGEPGSWQKQTLVEVLGDDRKRCFVQGNQLVQNVDCSLHKACLPRLRGNAEALPTGLPLGRTR